MFILYNAETLQFAFSEEKPETLNNDCEHLLFVDDENSSEFTVFVVDGPCTSSFEIKLNGNEEQFLENMYAYFSEFEIHKEDIDVAEKTVVNCSNQYTITQTEYECSDLCWFNMYRFVRIE